MHDAVKSVGIMSSPNQQEKDISIDILSDLTVFSKYARYIPSKQRRETWEEIVTRNMNMHIKKFPTLEKEIRANYKYVYEKKVLPSMRSMQFAGKPIEISPNRVYNCCYLPVDDYRVFSESMFLLLGGTGVGYSVQNHHVACLPEIRKPNKTRRYLIADSIEGWADAVKALTKSYFGMGAKPIFDFSDIRAKGARLVTSGGKAPGPDPLRLCLAKLESLLETKADGSKLAPIECHDMLCHIANAVLAGGIRRAAMIAGFSFQDEDMLKCKYNFTVNNYSHVQVERRIEDSGEVELIDSIHVDEKTGKKYFDLKVNITEPHYGTRDATAWWVSEEDFMLLQVTNALPWFYFQEQRGRSNNSAVVMRHKIKQAEFLDLWTKIKDSKSGEPGIYLSNDKDWFTNPCCLIGDTEIRCEDGKKTIKEIVELVNNGGVCKVETFNENTNKIELKTVIAGLLTKKDTKVLKLTIEENGVEYTVTSTDDHRFYTTNRGWVEAKDLDKNDDIQIYFSVK
jgi:hypothetical protein